MAVPSSTPPRRSFTRFFRFSLRTFCIVILGFSVVLGGFTWRWNRAQRQRGVREALWEQHKIRGSFRLVYDPSHPAPSWVQKKLEPWLGEDFFENVVMLSDGFDDQATPPLFFAALKHLPHIKDISVPGKLSPGMLHHLTQLRELEQLTVQRGSVNEDDLRAIGRLRKLKALYLGVEFQNSDLRHLRELNQLTFLGFGSSLNDEGLLAADCPATLEGLNLKKTQITDDGLVILNNLANLQYVNLAETKVSSKGLRHLPTCSKLADLRLQQTAIDDEAMQYVGQCKKLTDLRLEQTKVTDAGLQHLQDLTSLSWLDLQGTLVTGSGLEAIAGKCPLRYLSLGGQPHFAATSACLKPFERMPELAQLHFLSAKITPADLATVHWPLKLYRVEVGVPNVDLAALQPLSCCPDLVQIDIVRDVLPPATVKQLKAILPVYDHLDIETITGKAAADQ